ncbi:MAG: T9SS type A sorting domain-containing protein [bacterium]
MRKLVISNIIFFIMVFNLSALEKINFYEGKSVTIDGCFSKGEWSDADSVDLLLGGNYYVRIFYKHDGANLLFAFCDNLKIAQYQFRFPEVLFDINNTKTTTWDTEDHWFHVSATDCNSKGKPKDYTNCLLVQPDWLAEKNFMDANFNDTVEISIPFTKLGINPEQNKIFGIAFDVTDTQTFWVFYPATATMNKPSTWADAEIISGNGINDEENNSILIYPNPANNYIEIRKPTDDSEIRIFNSIGECVSISGTDVKALSTKLIDISELPAGLYYCIVVNETKNIVKSFVVLR